MDVIVIGGGVMGLSCAWRMAHGGAKVQLFESRRCGEGATLAALGALWPASPLSDGPLQRLQRASLAEFEDYIQTLTRDAGVPVRFKRLGRMEWMDSEKAMARAREEAAAGRGLGPEHALEYLDPGQVAAAEPAARPAPFGALLCHFTAQVVVRDMVDGLKAACLKAGVFLRENAAVTGFLNGGGAIADRTQIAAGRVLVAGGAWTKVLPELAKVPLRPVKGQGLALRVPREQMPGRLLKAGPIYLVPWHEAGEVLVGSTTEPDAGFDETPTADALAALRAGAADLLPALRNAPVLRHWAGLRPQTTTKRHPPVMGPLPGRENVWLCTGHFKTGIGMAPRVSRLISESILNNLLADELAPFAP